MSKRFDRTIALLGEDKFRALKAADVLIVGLGGVGGAVVECLARSGIGSFMLVDGDVFEPTNLNRQILCTEATLGSHKTEAAKDRIAAIDPAARVSVVTEYVTADNVRGIVGERKFSFCVDAIDDISAKVELVAACRGHDVPVISAMGAGNRTDCRFTVCDVYATKNDPLARKFRHELRARGVDSLDVICAETPPSLRRGTPASIAPPPTVMGAMIAQYVINRLCA
ncbi:MAG: ThiF family adenylyltransferase [Roseburia sp.]|nr:ThiF family adenylyltransferase [Roseburia sp.]